MVAPDPDPNGSDPNGSIDPGTPVRSAAAGTEGAATGTEPAPLIDWSRTARRLRAVLLVLGSAAVVLWLVLGFLGDGPTLGLLAELLGAAILAVFVVEVVVVGGTAIRGMLAAGERGDRLASQDVFLLPPQLLKGRRGSGDDPSGR